MLKTKNIASLSIALLLFIFSCKKDIEVTKYRANKLVIVLIDGPRWEETWGDPSHQYQPYLHNYLKSQGSLFTNFQNLGSTFTNPGHCAILTGNYESLVNNGTQLATYPSLAQCFLQKTKKDSHTSWLITSKDKLEIFKTCLQPEWQNAYTPQVDCGISGLGTGYRHDTITYKKTFEVLQNEHPEFLFVAFRDPDYSAHANDWTAYLNGIKNGDKYAYEIYNFLQNDPFYKNQTTFVITNDHGRHPNSIADGFISHGDNCDGCKHINLFMAGPDIKRNAIITNNYEQIDLHKTLSELYELNASYSKGKIISEVLIKPY